jgi:hypothetical protein
MRRGLLYEGGEGAEAHPLVIDLEGRGWLSTIFAMNSSISMVSCHAKRAAKTRRIAKAATGPH